MLIADVKELPTPFNQLCKAEKKSQICLQAASQGILQGGEGLCFELILGRIEIDHLCIEVLKPLNHSFVKISF